MKFPADGKKMKKELGKKYSYKADKAYDKKHGIKQGSKKDLALDNKRGVNDHKKKGIKTSGKFQGKSNKLGHGGRAAQLKAKGVPGGVIGNLARKAGAAKGGPNYHGKA